MNILVLDTETCLFRPGVMAPEIVCISYQRPGFEPGLVHQADPGALELVETSLRDSRVLLVGHHMAFDMAVLCAKWPHLLPLVFKAYDEDRIACTKIRQQLLDIAAGEFRGRKQVFEKEIEVEITEDDEDAEEGEVGTIVKKLVRGARWIPHNYELNDLIWRAAGRRLEKDEWRLRYSEFLEVPITKWPEGAQKYPKEDARATLDVFLVQEQHVEHIPDQFRQARAAWALHLTSVWGIRTRAAGVDALERETIEALQGVKETLQDAGLVRRGGKKDGTRDTKAAKARMVRVCTEQGKEVRMTAPTKRFPHGSVSLDSDACEASGDSLLEDYAEITFLSNTLSRDVEMLRAGVDFPVHTSFGMAASGRSTSAKPNVQNPKRRNEVYRDGKLKYTLPDVRECFVPRPYKIFAQADFSGLELHTLAQTCISLFGYSELGKVLNAGLDPHSDFACQILGISYEEGMKRKKAGDKEFDNARQTSKVANFGYPGGLGAESLCFFARKSYNVYLTEEQAKVLKQVWLQRWPEMKDFFNHCGTLAGDAGDGLMRQLFSDRWRGGCHYTALCNSWFQGLGADAAKRALYLVQRACYAESGSILYGSRPVNFVHDEIIMEVDDDERAHDKAIELGRLMIVGGTEFLPDVPPRIEPLLSRCWSKKSKPVFDGQKRLVAWSPAA
jgi:DNA polymerase I